MNFENELSRRLRNTERNHLLQTPNLRYVQQRVKQRSRKKKLVGGLAVSAALLAGGTVFFNTAKTPDTVIANTPTVSTESPASTAPDADFTPVVKQDSVNYKLEGDLITAKTDSGYIKIIDSYDSDRKRTYSLHRSDDSFQWTPDPVKMTGLPEEGRLQSLDFFDGRYVLVTTGKEITLSYSTDAVNWESHTLPETAIPGYNPMNKAIVAERIFVTSTVVNEDGVTIGYELGPDLVHQGRHIGLRDRGDFEPRGTVTSFVVSRSWNGTNLASSFPKTISPQIANIGDNYVLAAQDKDKRTPVVWQSNDRKTWSKVEGLEGDGHPNGVLTTENGKFTLTSITPTRTDETNFEVQITTKQSDNGEKWEITNQHTEQLEGWSNSGDYDMQVTDQGRFVVTTLPSSQSSLETRVVYSLDGENWEKIDLPSQEISKDFPGPEAKIPFSSPTNVSIIAADSEQVVWLDRSVRSEEKPEYGVFNVSLP